jgi:glycosyltransferase involved in cell wall biosynthesis
MIGILGTAMTTFAYRIPQNFGYGRCDWPTNAPPVAFPWIMMRVLFLTKYDAQAASARLRLIQYFPMLEKEGITCELSPLFDRNYLSHKFSKGNVSAGKALQSFLKRTNAVLRAGSSKVVVVQIELFPFLPDFFESSLRLRHIPYVYDYDDAFFHSYDSHSSPAVRLLLKNKIRNIISGAHFVLAGSPYLVDYARVTNRNVDWAPTCVDISRFTTKNWAHSLDRPFTIGWIGAPSSSHYAAEAIPAIRELARHIPLRLVYVGSGPVQYEGCTPEIHEWSEATEVEEMLQFDVGIMPLPDEPWTRGKCSFKLIQYMACGLPVVASAVGMNRNIVDTGKNGFLASSTEQWIRALETLAKDVALRKQMGANGRDLVEREFTTRVGGAKLLKAITSASAPN